MPDDYTRITRDLFRVNVADPQNAEVEFVPASAFPATLVLVLQDRPDLERALATPERGAILAVDMGWEVATKLYQSIWQVSRMTGLPLPRLDERQA